jgi:hypothetical protein
MARGDANENVLLPAVEIFWPLGHEVLTTAESGRAGQAMPDADGLACALAAPRLVVTLNRRQFIR